MIWSNSSYIYGYALNWIGLYPHRQYLRNREDTVRHIIHSLTDSSGELGGELELNPDNGVASIEDQSGGAGAVGDATDSSTDWENWCPAPSDADPTKLWTGKKPVIMFS